MENQNAFDLTQFSQVIFIGSGTYGEVYKIENTNSTEIYAAKVSLRFLSDNTEAYRDLKREVNILSRIYHPSILRFVGFSPINFHGEQKPVIITEYLSNGSLYDIIDLEKKGLCKDAWNDTRKLNCIYGIASAMSYLHLHKIIHRDLKPANILMDDFLCPKIADFGLSKIKHQNDKSMTADSTIGIKGTPLYIAPEIWTNMEYTPACDVYSFAIIVYEIITCEEPWKCLNIQQKVIDGIRPEIKSYVPKSYRRLIEKCWDQDPCKRPTFDEILEELENDGGFITDLVEQDDYFDYIDYINHSKKGFKKNPIQIDQYIKRKSPTFTRVSLSPKTDSMSTVQNPKTVNSSEKIKSKRSGLFNKKKSQILYPIHDLDKLDPTVQNLIKESIDDPEKEYEIGQYLIEGKNNFPQNTEIGLLYLDHSVKGGCLEAVIYYCQLLIKDDVIPHDYDKANKLIKKFRKTNNGQVLLLQGKIKKKQKEYSKAVKYFKKSSKCGNAESLYEYGKMLIKGLGCKKNEKQSKLYFEMAKNNGFNKSDKYLNPKEYYKNIADNGGSEEMYKYALMLDSSENIEYKQEATQYYKKAADKGNVDAMIRYAKILEKNDEKAKNKKDAARYYKMAADKGSSEAMQHYQSILEKNMDEERKGYNKSTGNTQRTNKGEATEMSDDVRYVKMNADKGNLKAINTYAFLLKHGLGVPNNYKEAARYYKMAADKRDPEGMYNYGRMLDEGDGVEVNQKEAARYYKMAADKGNAYAMERYALMLNLGIGIEENEKEAMRYHTMHCNAIKNLSKNKEQNEEDEESLLKNLSKEERSLLKKFSKEEKKEILKIKNFDNFNLKDVVLTYLACGKNSDSTLYLLINK